MTGKIELRHKSLVVRIIKEAPYTQFGCALSLVISVLPGQKCTRATGCRCERLPNEVSRAGRRGSNELLDEVVQEEAVYADGRT